MSEILTNKIIQSLPYGEGFLFVRKIIHVNDYEILAEVSFKDTDFYYQHHFSNKAFVPGVIMVEAMGQAGLVSHLIFLENLFFQKKQFYPLLSDIDVQFFISPVYNKTYFVKATKQYYRLNTLRSDVILFDENNEVFAKLNTAIKFVFYEK